MLLVFNQLIGFVNGDIRSFFFAQQIAVQNRAATRLSRVPNIASVKARKGKRLAINTLASSANFAIYQLLSRNGTLAIARLIGGSVFDYRAEQKGFEVLLSTKETVEFVKIPINGLSTSQRN